MSKTIAQIYSLTNLADALMCVELGADHIGVAFGDVDHLGPIQKTRQNTYLTIFRTMW